MSQRDVQREVKALLRDLLALAEKQVGRSKVRRAALEALKARYPVAMHWVGVE